VTSAMARVARLKYSHSDPLFRYSGLEPMSASNRESISLLLRGDVDVAFVPVTYAAQNRMRCRSFRILRYTAMAP